jgi:putative redox protein
MTVSNRHFYFRGVSFRQSPAYAEYHDFLMSICRKSRNVFCVRNLYTDEEKNMAKAKVILPKEGFKTDIISNGHLYHADEPIAEGGTDSAPTPTQMLMGALGSCIAITMRLYAQRKGWPLDGVEIELDFEKFRGADYALYSGDEPFVHEIRKSIRLIGNLSEEQKARIIEIGGKCPVHRMLQSPNFFVEEVLAAEKE